MVNEAMAIDGFSDTIGDISTTNRKQIRPIRWFTIDYNLIQTLRKINYQNSLAARCRTYIQDHLFSNDFLLFNSSGKEMKMTSEFRKFFYNRYTPFAMAAIDCIMTMGFIPVVLRQHHNGHMFPVVPADDTYVVQVGYSLDTEKRYYRVWRPKMFKLTGKNNKSSNDTSADLAGFLSGFVPKTPMGMAGSSKSGLTGFGGYGGMIQGATGMSGTGGVQENWFIDETVNIIDGFGHDPTVYGELTSPLRAILEDYNFTNTLADRLLISEYLMTNPVHLLQHHKDKDPDEKIDVSTGKQAFNFDADEFNMQVSDNLSMTQKQISTLNAQMRMIASMNERNRTSSGIASTNKDISEGVEVAPNLIVYPKGLESVKGEGLERFVGNKYVTIRQLFDDNLSAIFGIPLAIMRNVGNLRGNQTEQTNIFRQTIKKYAKMVSMILTIAFNEAYAGEEDKLEDNLFRKKAVVDDTSFTKLKQTSGSPIEILKDNTGKLPLPTNLSTIFEGPNQLDLGKTTNLPTDSNSAVFSADPEVNTRKIIEELQRKNREYEKKIREMEKRKRDDDQSEDDSENNPPSKKRKTFSGNFEMDNEVISNKVLKKDKGKSKDQIIIKVDITSFMDAKLVKHAYDAGAIGTEDYQRLLRNRLDFSEFSYKKPTKTSEQILAESFRAVGSEPPREDAMQPESENLSILASKFEKTKNIPSGILIDLAQQQGDIEKLSEKKDKERAALEQEKEREKEKTDSKTKTKPKPKPKPKNSSST